MADAGNRNEHFGSPRVAAYPWIGWGVVASIGWTSRDGKTKHTDQAQGF